jgi:hypothetical protein
MEEPMSPVKAGVVVLDCAEPEKLAVFYRELLDAEETCTSRDRVEIRRADGLRLAFRRDANVIPPSWPRPENAFQVHLDFLVDDLDEAERKVVALGGRPLEIRDAPGPFEKRGYADPAGHSFTLCLTVPVGPKEG